MVRVKSKVQIGLCSYMKTYGISTRYSTITIELSFYVLLYVYNCNVIINSSEKTAKKTWPLNKGLFKGLHTSRRSVSYYRCYSSTFLNMQHFLTEIYADPILDELGCHGEKEQDGHRGFNTLVFLSFFSPAPPSPSLSCLRIRLLFSIHAHTTSTYSPALSWIFLPPSSSL